MMTKNKSERKTIPNPIAKIDYSKNLTIKSEDPGPILIIPVGVINFNRVLELANEFEDVQEKIVFLKQLLEEYRTSPFKEFYGSIADWVVYSDRLRETIEDLKEIKKIKTGNNYEKIWFKVGLKFADGTLFDLCEKKPKDSWENISNKVFKTKSLHNFISFSFNNNVGLKNSNANKNIFLYSKKIREIKDYCNKNKILITQRFLDRIKPE